MDRAFLHVEEKQRCKGVKESCAQCDQRVSDTSPTKPTAQLGIYLSCPHVNAVGTWQLSYDARGLQRHGGMALIPAELQWRVTCTS